MEQCQGGFQRGSKAALARGRKPSTRSEISSPLKGEDEGEGEKGQPKNEAGLKLRFIEKIKEKDSNLRRSTLGKSRKN